MQTISPAIAGFKMDFPASPPNATLHKIFSKADAITIPKSHFQFLFQAAIIRAIKNIGTDKLIIILVTVHTPFKYSISNARNDNTKGLLAVGAGNQNILVNSPNTEANIPVRLFLKANNTIGIMNIGLIYQLITLWCLANAQLKNASLVRNNMINTTVATAKSIPNITSIFFVIITIPSYSCQLVLEMRHMFSFACSSLVIIYPTQLEDK